MTWGGNSPFLFSRENMNISLTDIEYFPKLSEETACFSAILCVDNKPIAKVRNHGTGGMHNYSPVGSLDEYNINKNLLSQAKKWAITLEPKIFQEYNITLANELDIVVDDMLEVWFADTKKQVVSYE
jgi:hypothetical protein